MSSSNPNDKMSVKFNGREVKNPIARYGLVAAVVVLIGLLVGGIVLIMSIGLPALLICIGILAIALLPLHFILTRLGRRGFFSTRRNADGSSTFTFSVGAASFRKQ